MNKRSVVSYTLDQCVKCLKCVKACPSSALSMIDNRIIVSDERCLNCGKCISACHNKGLLAPGSTLSDIDNYDYTVCMVPSALTSNCASKAEAEQLFHA
ncbi:MAG: 4Fe-4S binding protein, partial [Solobacterium sp.]|nr:4Fe-4S binding protein [Solobacterium sp.]